MHGGPPQLCNSHAFFMASFSFFPTKWYALPAYTCPTKSCTTFLPAYELLVPSCWVFNHQHRAGGSTIKYMLQAWADGREDTSVGLYDSTQWLKGADFARGFLAEENSLTWGAYTEGLRPHVGGDKCKWFTIFRQ